MPSPRPIRSGQNLERQSRSSGALAERIGRTGLRHEARRFVGILKASGAQQEGPKFPTVPGVKMKPGSVNVPVKLMSETVTALAANTSVPVPGLHSNWSCRWC